MRRVIVDQIEALAELNRIVARHGRGLDAVEPARARRVEAVEAGAAPRRCAQRAARSPMAARGPSRAARRAPTSPA